MFPTQEMVYYCHHSAEQWEQELRWTTEKNNNMAILGLNNIYRQEELISAAIKKQLNLKIGKRLYCIYIYLVHC